MTDDAYASTDSSDVIPADTAVIAAAATADVLEQRLPALFSDEARPALPSSLPDAVDPADALDQSLPVGDVDEER